MLNIKNFVNMLTYLLGGMWIISGFSKFFSFSYFITVVSKLSILTDIKIIVILSSALISIEIIVGLLFFINRYRIFCTDLSIVLLSFFLALSLYSIFIGLNIKCGCFGRYSSQLTSFNHILLLIVLLFISIFIHYNLKEQK